ncbi:MAG TPA: histidine kinase [Trebonia sp.]
MYSWSRPSRIRLPLGIRPADLLTVAVVIGVVELDVIVGGGTGATPLNAQAYVLGAVIALPVLLRRRWPRGVLCATFMIMIVYYSLDRRNISPAPVMFAPVYETALAGYLAWAIGVPALIMTLGLVFSGAWGGWTARDLITGFLPSIVIFILAVALGEVVRSRRALTAETAHRLRLAEEERRAEAARLLAEERLRIARELHDTVAHSMATITIAASAALRLAPPSPDGHVQDALLTIRETSKSALEQMRAVLGQLRGQTEVRGQTGLRGETGPAGGLSRLPELRAAVTAAGSPVTVTVDGLAEGDSGPPLPPAVDHAAYRILQESLTNVLRHAPAGAPADVRLRYTPGRLTVSVTNDGGAGINDAVPAAGPGNGIRGMRERAAEAGGSLAAGPRPRGGFEVIAVLPLAEGTS